MIAWLVVTALVVAAAGAGWGYFRRFELLRPPIGVFDWHDVVFLVVAIAVIPFAYLALPRLAVGVVLCLVALNVLYFGLEPVLRLRPWIWAAALGLLTVDVAVTVAAGAGSPAMLAVNDLELVLLAVFVSNVLAQSGMRARDLSLVVCALAVYDLVATSVLGLMGDLLRRLATLPFAPLVAWREDGRWLGLGLGDLLVVVLAPLVFRKAFGRTAGVSAAATSALAVAGMLAALRLEAIRSDVPVMVVLAPLLLPQYAWWRLRRGGERRTWEYLEAEAPGARVTREAVESARERAAERRRRSPRGDGRRRTATAAMERR